MKLRLGLQRVEDVVFGRVLEQDESLRECNNIVEGGQQIRYITSISEPALDSGALLIRGDACNKDNQWFAQRYDSPAIAIQVVADIKMLVAKINADEQQGELDDCGLVVIE